MTNHTPEALISSISGDYFLGNDAELELAKNIVAHGLSDKCEVGLAYVIGQPRPLMQTIETFGTSKVSEKALYDFKDKLLDTSVRSIIETLRLARPIYTATAAYGHFGRSNFPWEKVVK